MPQLLCDLRPKDLIFSRSTAYKEGKWVRPVCLLPVPPRAPAFRSSPGVQGQLPAPLSTSRAPSLASLLLTLLVLLGVATLPACALASRAVDAPHDDAGALGRRSLEKQPAGDGFRGVVSGLAPSYKEPVAALMGWSAFLVPARRRLAARGCTCLAGKVCCRASVTRVCVRALCLCACARAPGPCSGALARFPCLPAFLAAGCLPPSILSTFGRCSWSEILPRVGASSLRGAVCSANFAWSSRGVRIHARVCACGCVCVYGCVLRAASACVLRAACCVRRRPVCTATPGPRTRVRSRHPLGPARRASTGSSHGASLAVR